MILEEKKTGLPGLGILAVHVVGIPLLGYLLLRSIVTESLLGMFLAAPLLLLVLIALPGYFTVNPNQGRVLQLFGRYRGTVRTTGLRWANPFYTKKRVSLRVRNFETGKLKVNDKRGNPIEFAAVVVWQVVDTAEA
ncbi:MAG: SPFH domain-containing protein, partial [Acidobacteria bacterium]